MWVVSGGGALRVRHTGQGRQGSFGAWRTASPAATFGLKTEKGKKMEPIKILVVDNEEDQRRLISIILTKFGYFVKTVSSAEAALKDLESTSYQLIITDLIMPEMDGTELCERIKRIRPEGKVYAISGHAELYDDNKLAKFGFDGVIQKPVSMNSLKETVEFALGNSDSKSAES